MKFNTGRIKSKLLLILLLILITTINIGILPIFNGSTKLEDQNINHDTSKDNINKIPHLQNLDTPPNASFFKYYKVITINDDKVKGTDNHVNFPLLISIFDSDLHNEVQSDGDDIAFSNGTIWLAHEIELFVQAYNSTHAKLVAWVKVPTLYAQADTVIFIYYSNTSMTSRQNPTSVWDSNYKGVWHLNQNPPGTIQDSTINNRDGTTSGMDSSDLVDAKIGKGLEFDGSNDYIQTTSNDLLSATDFTIEAWFNTDSTSRRHIVWEGDSTGDGGGSEHEVHIGIGDCTNDQNPDNVLSIFLEGSSDDVDYVISFTDTTNYYHFVGVFTGIGSGSPTDTGELFLNGNSRGIESSDSTSRSGWNTNLRIGRPGASTRYFDGIIDEVRISTNARSPSWITTEYNNHYDPNSFYSISERFIVSSSIPGNFRYYKEITIDHTKVTGPSTLANFPLLISLYDTDLLNNVQSDGDDIAFFKDGRQLAHEIELFNQAYNGTHAQLIVWVCLPYIFSVKDTKFLMLYNNVSLTSQQNPSGVWDNYYKGVWHLKENPSVTPPQMKDSASPFTDGTTSGSMLTADQVTGKVDGSLNFDGANDYVDFGNPSELGITGAITVEAWFKADSFGTDDYLINKMGSNYQRGWEISFDRTDSTHGTIMFRYDQNGQDPIETVGSSSVTAGQLYHVVGVFCPTEYASLFVDGIETKDSSSIPSSLFNPSVNVRIARKSDSTGTYFNGIIDEVRLSNKVRSTNWITTEYNNQINPASFYSINIENFTKQLTGLEAQINALDINGNLVPNVNITILKDNNIIKSGVTSSDGSVIFTNITENYYNFTAKITSDDNTYVEIVNVTNNFLIDTPFQIINLTCNIGSNFFKVLDIDENPVESGVILVGNNSVIFRNCTIDINGNARFSWLNNTPYQYNYTILYKNELYNLGNAIILAEGDINEPNLPNDPILIPVNLTTVNFTIVGGTERIAVSGAKLIIRRQDNTLSIVNLTTDISGKATLRWLNSSGFISGYIVNYSLQIEFFNSLKLFNTTIEGPLDTSKFNFTVSSAKAYKFIISVDPNDFQTEIVSINPNDYKEIEWGTMIKIRVLFTITKAIGFPLGPTNADVMQYRIQLGIETLGSGTMSLEDDTIGRYFCLIDTSQLESDEFYLIIISAQKSGFTIPSEIFFQLKLLKNNMILNQTENDNSVEEAYWNETIDMQVTPYGQISEQFVIADNIYKESIGNDYIFELSIPHPHTDWNLTRLIFNIENINFSVTESDIYIKIIDNDLGIEFLWTENNGTYEWYGQYATNGSWKNLLINLNKGSLYSDNSFNYRIEGSFTGTIDVSVDATFLRDMIFIEYYESNISGSIDIPSDGNGWAISNITFDILHCQYLNGTPVDPSIVIDNITTNEGYFTNYIYDTLSGTGKININDTIIYPITSQFSLYIGNNSNIIFDVWIMIEYIQEFYDNQNLESITLSQNAHASNNSVIIIQISPLEEGWIEESNLLLLDGINNGNQFFNPSELAMNITIDGQKFSISNDITGKGTFSLENVFGFNRDTIYAAVIETTQPINFTISFSINNRRTVFYKTTGFVYYNLSLDIHGVVLFNEELGYYQQIIDTSLLNAGDYTVGFTINKDHYERDTINLDLRVLERLTLISGSSINIDLYPTIYVTDAINYTFSYTDVLTTFDISNLDVQSYTISKIGSGGQSEAYGAGDLYFTSNNQFVLNINSEQLQIGRYTIWITFEKQNYEPKEAILFLTVNEREIDYNLGNMFDERQVSVIKGEKIALSIELTDPTRDDSSLIDAKVILEIGDEEFEFEEVDDGIYELELDTKNYDAFITSTTINGIIKISKGNYTSEEIDITIVIEMEQLEVIPGVIKLPTFYLLVIIAALIAIVGSLATYKYIQQMRIPKFVKKADIIKKAIKSSKEIDASILYPLKEAYIISAVGDKWNPIGLSLENILGLKIKKESKIFRSFPTSLIPVRAPDINPLGLILMKWDQKKGTHILAKYPRDVTISQKTLMQIYGTHEYTGESGTITLMVGTLNLLSYYTGPEKGYYLILILNFDDDPDYYEGAMADILRIILQNLEDESYLHLIPSLFQRLAVFPNLTIEGRIAYIYQDEIKRMIINRLREEGVINKSELIVWLKDKYREGFIDFESILSEFMKLDIIKEVSIKGIPSELIFLINDPIMIRIPPVQLLENPERLGLPSYLTETYKMEVKNFFQNYRPLEQDNINIIDILIDPQIYETLKLLRTAIITRNDLEKLKKKGVTDFNRVLKDLWEREMIKVFQDKSGNEYYALLSDFYLDMIFPKYLLNIIKNVYDQKSKDDKVLIEYLKILEDFYMDIKTRK